jgi:hypothetical protein
MRPTSVFLAAIVLLIWLPSARRRSQRRMSWDGTPDLQAVASSPTRFASLSCSSLPRYTSKVGAVCVEAFVRICAGAFSDGRPYRVSWAPQVRALRDLFHLIPPNS